jgi:hypothetical protein
MKFPSIVLDASIFSKPIGLSNYGLSERTFLTIGLLEYRISDRQTIGLSDIGYQTQTIGLLDIGYNKKKLSIAQLWYLDYEHFFEPGLGIFLCLWNLNISVYPDYEYYRVQN